MRDATIYHRRAAECRELAEHSASAAHRATWRELELLWLRLASEAERRAGPPTASDVHLPGLGGSAAGSAGIGTVVFVYSEPDPRRKDTADAPSRPDRPTSEEGEATLGEPETDEPAAY